LYDQLVTFHFKYIYLLNPAFYTHHTLKDNLKNIKYEYNICMEYFHRNKIFLTESLIQKIKDLETNFNTIKLYFEHELDLLKQAEDRVESTNPNHIYGDDSGEVNAIRLRLEALRMKEGIMNFESEIRGFRKLVEDYFKELTT